MTDLSPRHQEADHLSSGCLPVTAATGLQPDGTYVPCPDCGCEPTTHEGPGVAIRMPGTLHHRTCPRVPDLTPSAELLAELVEIRELERRAWAFAQTVVLR